EYHRLASSYVGSVRIAMRNRRHGRPSWWLVLHRRPPLDGRPCCGCSPSSTGCLREPSAIESSNGEDPDAARETSHPRRWGARCSRTEANGSSAAGDTREGDPRGSRRVPRLGPRGLPGVREAPEAARCQNHEEHEDDEEGRGMIAAIYARKST